jgi:MFS family permease
MSSSKSETLRQSLATKSLLTSTNPYIDSPPH